MARRRDGRTGDGGEAKGGRWGRAAGTRRLRVHDVQGAGELTTALTSHHESPAKGMKGRWIGDDAPLATHTPSSIHPPHAHPPPRVARLTLRRELRVQLLLARALRDDDDGVALARDDRLQVREHRRGALQRCGGLG